MKHKIAILMIILLVPFAFFACANNASNEQVTEGYNVSEEVNPDEDMMDSGTEPVDFDTESIASNLPWIVEPSLAYDMLFHCSEHGYVTFNITRFEEYVIDERTGQSTGEFHGAHCGPGMILWFYDPMKSQFGAYRMFGATDYVELEIYPMDEFAIRFPEYMDRILAVRLVNTSYIRKEIIYEDENYVEYRVYFEDGAFLDDRQAIAYGGRILSDFIFDGVADARDWGMSVSYVFKNVIPVSKDGKWGFLDRNGNDVVPFVFDDIVTNGNTAFALYNGVYGILELSRLTNI